MNAGSSSTRNGPVSHTELARRWQKVRAAMRKGGFDVLIAQGNNDHMGGYGRYLTDHPACNGYPVTVVFPLEGGMTLVRQGPFDGRTTLQGLEDTTYPGVAEVRTTPSFATAAYTSRYDADLILDSIRPFERGRIGLLAAAQVPHTFVAYLQEVFPSAQFEDASELVDRIRAIKSEEELAAIRVTTGIQDRAMAAAFAIARPGLRESDITAEAQYVSQKLGSEQGIYLCASGPQGAHLRLQQRHYQNRRLEAGDQVILLVENNGPGGQYGELGRTCVLGKASADLKDEFRFTLEARAFVLDQLMPGVGAAEVYDRYSTFMRAHGRPEDRRIFAHSQGTDMVERPLLRQDETLTVQARMNLAIHPSYHHGVTSWICDNFLIGGNGRPERLHSFAEEIVEV